MTDQFFGDTVRKATRKPHRCESCQTVIPKGSRVVYSSSVQDGEFWGWYTHPECRKAETAWNNLQDHWGDEYQWLWEMFENNEPLDYAWLVAEYPVVAGRMGISIEGCRKPRSGYWDWAP